MNNKVSILKHITAIILALFSIAAIALDITVYKPGFSDIAFVRLFTDIKASTSIEPIAALAVFILLIIVYMRILPIKNRRTLTAAFIAGALLSAATLIGMSFEHCGSLKDIVGGAIRLVKSTSVFIGYTAMFTVFLSYSFEKLSVVLLREGDGRITWSKKTFFTLWAAIFVCYIPYLIIFFPGTLGGDTIDQIFQFYGYRVHLGVFLGAKEAALVNQNPVFTTVIFGAFIKLGELLGSQNTGIFIYCTIQSAVFAGLFAFSLCYMARLRMPRWFKNASLIFWALFIGVSLYAINMSKDMLHTVFYVIYILMLTELVRDPQTCLHNKKFLIGFAACALLLMLTKQLGLAIVITTSVVLLIVFRRHWLRIAATAAIPVILFCSYTAILPSLGVVPAGDHEVLGFFFQQTARYCKTWPEEVTPEERDAIDAVLDYDQIIENYNRKLNDPVKFTFKSDSTKEEIRAYFKTYFAQLAKHPGTCINAVVNNIYDYFWMDKTLKLYDDINPSVLERKYQLNPGARKVITFGTPESTHDLRESVMHLYHFTAKIPGIGLIWFIALYVWLAVIAFIFIIAKGSKRWLATIVPAAVLTIMMLFSPVNGNTRYIIQIVYTLPLVATACALSVREKAHQSTQAPALNEPSEE